MAAVTRKRPKRGNRFGEGILSTTTTTMTATGHSHVALLGQQSTYRQLQQILQRALFLFYNQKLMNAVSEKSCNTAQRRQQQTGSGK